MDPTRGTARSIVKVGLKVEVSFEEADLRGVWFPATVVEELGSNLFLVEYQCSGNNDEPELRKVTVDHLHIRPSTPPLRDTNFVLLEKVDAFYDFGWWTGVITKKLADSRYIVYFKHTNKEREVGHLDLRLHVEHGDSNSVKRSNVERATVLLNFTGPIEDTNTTPGIEKQTSIVATTMKRTKVTSAGSSDKHLKPSKKLKPGITFDDQTLSDVGPSKEVSNPTVGQSDQTFDKTENPSRPKRMPVKREKVVELNSPMITSSRKKGRPVAYSRDVKALPKGGTGDLINIKTPKIVEKEHVTRELLPPITCVMGLQCKMKTLSQIKKVKSPTQNPPKVVESETPQSVAPLASKTTGGQDPNLVSDEGGGGTSLKRKRGRPFKSKAKNPKTPLAVNHENGDAGKEIVVHELQITGSPNPPQVKNTPEVDVEKLSKTSAGKGSTVQLEKSPSVKGKRGKRRKISSINIVSPAQGVQDSLSKQKENGVLLENESSEVLVEKSPDTMSDDQPLSRWFEGIQHHQPLTTLKKQIENIKYPSIVTNGDTLSFEKRSTLWATLESMELFHMIPQKPHFRPLDNEKECTREGQAISKMVTYLRVVEATSQLKLENPRSMYEDNLEALVELESHGFDVKAVRDRLTGLLLIKEKQETLEEESRKVKDKMELERVEGQRIDKEIELVDKQVVALLEKRAQVLKKKEKKDAEVGALEAEVDGINEGINEVKCKFDGLAAASLCVSEEQTPGA